MSEINSELLQKLLMIAGGKLSGNWIIIGGTVLPIIGINYRVTMDIDLIAEKETQMTETLKLMDIAESLGLPVEAINQAGAHYLYKIKNFRKHLISVHKGKSAHIFRPDCYLFILLKINRLSESDLSDCLRYISYSRERNEKIDKNLILKSINSYLSSANGDRKERLKKLLKEVDF